MNKKYIINVINLDERLDRLQLITNEFAKQSNFELKRFSAIEHKEGWRGCSLSHLALIKQAQIEKLPFIIVVEDDNKILDLKTFNDAFKAICQYLENNMTKWDVFSMCCTYSNEGQNKKVVLVNQKLGLVEYQFGKTTNFMIYNQSSYKRILALEPQFLEPNSKQQNHTIDVASGGLGLRFWTKIPFLCAQRIGYSDITKETEDYLSVFKENELYLLKLSMHNASLLGKLVIIIKRMKLFFCFTFSYSGK